MCASLAPALLAACCQPRHDLPSREGAHLQAHPALSKMSGLEASPSIPDTYWTVNDSGSRSRLYRIGTDGRNVGHVALRARNWWAPKPSRCGMRRTARCGRRSHDLRFFCVPPALAYSDMLCMPPRPGATGPAIP
ncbi:hypothetical protein BH23PSE2_BH23PSE2_14080 [soil metagenome]